MKVGISACSNGQDPEYIPQIAELIKVFDKFGIEAVPAPHIVKRVDEFSGTDEERAADLMSFYRDDSIDAIYDISGGDLANGVLKYLDFDLISASDKAFWGYSDLTTIINAIVTDKIAPMTSGWYGRQERDWSSLWNKVDSAIDKIIADNRDEIIEKAAEKLVKSARSTKAWKEKFAEVISEVENG